MEQLFTLLSGGADAAIIAIGVILMRMERRLTRLEFKVFGFGFDVDKSGRGPG